MCFFVSVVLFFPVLRVFRLLPYVFCLFGGGCHTDIGPPYYLLSVWTYINIDIYTGGYWLFLMIMIMMRSLCETIALLVPSTAKTKRRRANKTEIKKSKKGDKRRERKQNKTNLCWCFVFFFS